MKPLWIKESDEKANKWHEQQKRSPLGSTGPPGVCCILLQYRALKSLLHSLNVVFGTITLDFGFWGEKGHFGKKSSKTDKRWASAVTSSSFIRSQSKMESRANQGRMFHPYVLPVFSCSSYFWPSLSCMFFLMGNKSKWNLINLQLWWQELFHQLKSTPYTISLRSKTLLIWHIVVFMFGWWKCSHMNEIITIKVLRIPIPHSIHPMCPWSNLRVNKNISRESVLITGCGMHDWFHLHFWWNWFVCT